MKVSKLLKHQLFMLRGCGKLLAVLAVLASVYLPTQSRGQGTMTLGFEGLPRGTLRETGPYYEQGMQFQPVPLGNLYLSGGGVPPYPDNGTGNLVLPENGYLHGGLTFGPTNAFPASALFSLVAFDAAEYWDAGATNFTVIGYKPMGGTVTNTFAAQVSTWQTFNLSSSFVDLFRVDIYASSYYGRFSLDNVVIGGVPEPSAASLMLVGIWCAYWRFSTRNRRS